MVLEYWHGTRLTSPLPNIFTGVDMKSIIETELPSSSELYTSGAESLVESGESHTDYLLYKVYEVGGLHGNEMEVIISKVYTCVSGIKIPFICSLFELKQALYCCDGLITHTEFEENNPTLGEFDGFISKHKIHREAILSAIENSNYSDDVILTDSELEELRTPIEFNDYIDTNFSVYEFTKALEEDKYLIKVALRNKENSHKQSLLDLREAIYQNITLNMTNKQREYFFELHKYDKTYFFKYDTI